MPAPAIGQKDEGDAEPLEQGKSLSGVWEWVGRSEKDAVDAVMVC